MSTIERADSDIQHEIRQSLASVGLPLTVDVDAGVVTLGGIVLSEEEREAALDLAQIVAGVTDIVDQLELAEFDGDYPDVLPGLLTRVGDGDLLSDDEDDDWTTDIQRVIQDGDSWIPPTDPPIDMARRPGGIEVAAGFQASSAEEDDSDRGTVDDARIIESVIRELNEDSATTHLNLHVASVNGTVVLTGYSTDPNDGDEAAAVASRVPGVRHVVDRLMLGEEPTPVRRVSISRVRDRVLMPSSTWRAVVARNGAKLPEMLEKTTRRIAEVEEQMALLGRDQADEGSFSNHLGDLASDVTSAETLNAELVGLREQVSTIEALQRRFDVGLYGVCSSCHQFIDPARLRAFPLALRCIDCQRQLEAQIGQ
jgi:DnaK suppressor protein